MSDRQGRPNPPQAVGPGVRKHVRAWRPATFADTYRQPRHSAPDRPRPEGMPTPVSDSEIETALDLLRSVPFEELQRRGWHLQPNHYYWPLNDIPFLRQHPEIWARPMVPAEIDWDLDGQVELLRDLSVYFSELGDVRDSGGAPGELVWNNDSFPRVDAMAYYALVRRLQPRNIVEVGAGWSTLAMARALHAGSATCDVMVIDPEMRTDILGELPAAWTLLESPVQLADTALFEKLGAGDILFYDGSHCAHTGSDVNWILFEIIPRLSAGVWIHIHDLNWPRDYSPLLVMDEGLSWNEQYVVQAFLMGNAMYRVRIAMAMLCAFRGDETATLVGVGNHGVSLWIEKQSALDAAS
jgi:hypothetical protein